MFFLQAAQADVAIRLGKYKFLVPKFEMDDVVQWGVEVAETQNELHTRDFDEVRKQEWNAFYGRMSLTFDELKRLLRTPLGVEKVFKTCMKKAKVFKVTQEAIPADVAKRTKARPEKVVEAPALTDEQVEAVYKVNGPGRLSGFVWVLADLDDTSLMKDPTEGNDKDDEDPLKLLGKAVSKA